MPIKLVVFDWAGTTVDHGCFAPVAPFVDALAQHGVNITAEQARGPMGLEKRDHLRALIGLPDAQRQWLEAHGSACGEADIDRIFADFVPLQLASVTGASVLIDGVLDTVAALRAQRIKIGTSTGYFAEAAERCYAAAAAQGYVPNCNVHPGNVTQGRPAPWMIFRNMETLAVYPPADVVKVGDTAPDIAEGLSAGAWSIGVAASGSEVGLSAGELASLPAAKRSRQVEEARTHLYEAGAHFVLDTVRDLPPLIATINELRARGESPAVIVR
jgi:phosphonoacetaldehyde hydrolase